MWLHDEAFSDTVVLLQPCREKPRSVAVFVSGCCLSTTPPPQEQRLYWQESAPADKAPFTLALFIGETPVVRGVGFFFFLKPPPNDKSSADEEPA